MEQQQLAGAVQTEVVVWQKLPTGICTPPRMEMYIRTAATDGINITVTDPGHQPTDLRQLLRTPELLRHPQRKCRVHFKTVSGAIPEQASGVAEEDLEGAATVVAASAAVAGVEAAAGVEVEAVLAGVEDNA
jgi:hypothetical protein